MQLLHWRHLIIGLIAQVVIALVTPATLLALPVVAVPQPQGRQQRPQFNPLPAKTPLSDGLILMAHGWNSNAGVWAGPLGFTILHQLFANGTSQDWDIIAYDWRNQAATRLPGEAANRGRTIGESLGQDILNAGYARVHLIGHSAGSWLIDGVADVITRNPRNTPGPAMKTIHATFLDAYVPDPATARIGDNTTFSDHYVDNREVIRLGVNISQTNPTLPHAFNIDITGLEVPPSNGFDNHHAWPYRWYDRSASLPATAAAEAGGWGFARTMEMFNIPNHADFARGGRMAFPAPGGGGGGGAAFNFEPAIDFSVTANTFSPNGTVDTTGGTALTLATGSEVWLTSLIQTTTVTNVMKFDYEFLSLGVGEGWLSVYVDINGNCVFDDSERFFEADEVYGDLGQNFAYAWFGGKMHPGEHFIAFRVDPLAAGQALLELSNVQLGFAPTTVPEPGTLTLLGLGIIGLLVHGWRRWKR